MPSLIVEKILERIGYPDLVRALAQDISGTELNTLLLEVFDHRTKACTPPELLRLYGLNRFVKPADLPVIDLKKMELDILELFQQCAFEPIELSPVAAIGSCSVVAPADQKKILSALRGTEVLADATNSLALHIAHLKKEKSWTPKEPSERMRFAVIQRHLRTQQITGTGFTPHFKIGCLVSAGYDTGSFAFEKEAMREHIQSMKEIFRNYFKVEGLSFRFLCRTGGYSDPVELARQVKAFIEKEHPDTIVTIVEAPEKTISYYKGIQYKVDIIVNGKSYEIGDGGFVDWTQQLLQNRKERMFSTGFGFEYMYRILKGHI